MDSHWLTMAEADEYAKIKISTLRRWIAEGVIKPVVTRQKKDIKGPGASGFIVDSRDLDRVLENLKQDMSGVTNASAHKAIGRTYHHR